MCCLRISRFIVWANSDFSVKLNKRVRFLVVCYFTRVIVQGDLTIFLNRANYTSLKVLMNLKLKLRKINFSSDSLSLKIQIVCFSLRLILALNIIVTTNFILLQFPERDMYISY